MKLDDDAMEGRLAEIEALLHEPCPRSWTDELAKLGGHCDWLLAQVRELQAENTAMRKLYTVAHENVDITHIRDSLGSLEWFIAGLTHQTAAMRELVEVARIVVGNT